jgi:hypothetical protein
LCVFGVKVPVDGEGLIASASRDKLETAGSHREAGSRVDVRLQDVRTDDCEAEHVSCRLAGVRIDDVLSFLIYA